MPPILGPPIAWTGPAGQHPANRPQRFRAVAPGTGRNPSTCLGLQIRRNTSEPLVPPKPNEFDIAISTCCSRAVCGT